MGEKVRCAVHDLIFETHRPEFYSGEPQSDCPKCKQAAGPSSDSPIASPAADRGPAHRGFAWLGFRGRRG